MTATEPLHLAITLLCGRIHQVPADRALAFVVGRFRRRGRNGFANECRRSGRTGVGNRLWLGRWNVIVRQRNVIVRQRQMERVDRRFVSAW